MSAEDDCTLLGATAPTGSVFDSHPVHSVSDFGAELPAGYALGDYRIEHVIGQGGCGVVYAARRLDGQGTAAIKVMHAFLSSSRKAVERFVREVSVVRLIHHPGIVDIYDLGQLSDGRPYYVMEHLPGKPLSALLRARGRLPLDETLSLLQPVCAALAAAHDAGIVHRDVKASNVLVGPDQRVKLIDFGIAKLSQGPDGGSGFTTLGRHVGTLSAMAPEQILGGRVDARTDVYAVGLLLFQMLTGQHPFWSDDQVELAWRHVETPPPRPSARVRVSSAVDAVVLRCLEKSPERRFESVRAFLAALCEAAGGRAPVEAGVHDGLAAGICVEFAVELTGELPAETLGDLGRALDLAEDMLQSAGYRVVLAAGALLLAARPLREVESREENAAEAEARQLLRTLTERPDPDPRVRPRVQSHVAAALLRLSSVPELLGGPLSDLTTWPVSPAGEAFPLCPVRSP
ncbi:protein kinase [Chondromyces crocatus]|uniref:Protein kinase n=2 Tax=Chondromyces crocatus TaxID=52 RepID=A0A0K1ERV3_CHOCO|nr:protein kinase [Chondromyces crocatus]